MPKPERNYVETLIGFTILATMLRQSREEYPDNDDFLTGIFVLTGMVADIIASFDGSVEANTRLFKDAMALSTMAFRLACEGDSKIDFDASKVMPDHIDELKNVVSDMAESMKTALAEGTFDPSNTPDWKT